MRSMQVLEFGQPLVQTESAVPVPTGKEILLRVKAAGVCHTDLHLWHGGYDLGHGKRLSMAERGVKLPLTMGHENVGMVLAVGDEVRNVKVGDVRLVYPWNGCGHCEVCLAGQENYCLTPCTVGINRPGGYSDHLVVPDERYLVDLKGVSAIKAAPLACSGLTCYSALRKFNQARLQRNHMVIVGAGGLGLMALALLKAMGGKGAVVVEPDAARRQAALDAGAVAVVDPNADDAAPQIQEAAGGAVYDVLDFVSNPQTTELGFNVVTKGGHMVLVGLFGGAAPWPLPLIAMRAITIQGSYVGSLGELQELVELVAKENLSLIPVTTCSLDALGQALQDLEQGKILGRMVMTPEA